LDKEKIYEILHPQKLKGWIKSAFKEADISSLEYLKNDEKIEKAAQIALKKIPRFPYRTIIKTTIGEKGFSKFIFKIRDKMIDAKSIDFSLINTENIKSYFSNLKK
jgi:hypothetical protein